MDSIKVPTFSIITVVYNGETLLEGTFQSVFSQTFTDFEYVVVDGASTDGTLAFIEKHESRIDTWISEKDKGLYDAMNKGLKLAKGDYVLFLNAGDHLFAPTTLQTVASYINEGVDVLYGEVMLVDEDRKQLGTRTERTTQQLPEVLDWRSLQQGMVVCHQAFLPKRTLCPSYMSGNLTADIDWVIRILKVAKVVVHTHTVIAAYLEGGLSKKRHQQSLKDRWKVMVHHYGFLQTAWSHVRIALRAAGHRLFKKIP